MFLSNIFGDSSKKYLKKINVFAEKANQLEGEFSKLSQDALKEKSGELKKKIKSGEPPEKFLSEAFALVRESSKRTICQRQYDVQILAGIAMYQGKIVEMKTGEGKTLAATMPAFLSSLEGKGVHVVTVNDYLSKRDAVWMGQIYDALGISVGCIIHDNSYIYEPNCQEKIKNEKLESKNNEDELDKERDLVGGFKIIENFLKPCSRKEAYAADITYGTNNEFGFDYLRDNMAFDLSEKVQRGFHFAIVDEIDSILIDEARTPLIISSPDMESSKWYKEFSRIVPNLRENSDYNIDEKMKAVSLTEEGIEKIEKILGVKNIYEEKGMKYLHYLEQSLKAEVFFRKDRDFIVKDGKIIIVDEFTGRLMPGRRWSGGLHQAVEAKEGLEVLPESKTLASITFQNYFRMYEGLSGMTGTAVTSAEEFEKVYDLEIIVVPTNKPMVREDLPDKIFKTEFGKLKAIVKDVSGRSKSGQPVLIGTSSIEKNELLAEMLKKEGISCEILNAKNHEREGAIIAQAGKKGRITAATNMAGRGVDIILGGNPPDEKEAEEIKDAGGLHVIGSQRHEARRIDDQLRGRAGRQGDPGSSQFFISLEDDILRIFGGDRIKNLMEMLKIPEDEPIEAKMISGAIEKAQSRVEGINFDVRKHVLEYDDVISKHRNKVYFLRDEILRKNYEELKKWMLETVFSEIKKIIEIHSEEQGLDCEEIFEEVKTIVPLSFDSRSEIRNAENAEMAAENIFKATKGFFDKKEKEEGWENMEKILRFVSLKSIDFFWTEHLSIMEELKDSVRLRAYGGRDPLVEYKTEGHKLFQEFQSAVNSQISKTVFKLTAKNS